MRIMNNRTLGLSFALSIASMVGCQSIRKHDSDDHPPGNSGDQITQAVGASIQAGSWPQPLVTLASMGGSSQDSADPNNLKDWLNADDYLRLKKVSSDSGSSPTIYNDSESSAFEGMKCLLDTFKMTIQAKGDLVAITSSIDAASCQSHFQKDDDELYKAISSDGTSTGFSMSLSYPNELRGLSVFQCPGADLSPLNGTVVVGINDIDSDKSPILLQIRKACTYTDDWSTLKKWSRSGTQSYYQFWAKKAQDGTVSRGSKTFTRKQGALSSQAAACERIKDGSDFLIRDCTVFSASVVSQFKGSNLESSSPNRSILQATDLRESTDVTYKSGSVRFEKGQWVGTLTFYGNSKSPYWTASMSTGASASGTLNSSSSLNGGFSLNGNGSAVAFPQMPWEKLSGF